jgi:hypothetical protein
VDLPQAIREENSPLDLVGLLGGGLGHFLVFLRWTSYKCPHCGHVFRRAYWPANVKLGEGVRHCSDCGLEFDDGSREWPQLPFFSKLRVFFPPLLVGIWGGHVAAAILSLFIPAQDGHNLDIFILVSTFGLIPTLVWAPYPLYSVICSIRRYNDRRSIGTP